MAEEGGSAGASRRGAASEAGGGAALQPHSFKLRFAAQREPGRSNVSLVKPLGLPATVADKVQARAAADGSERAAEEAALARVRRAFAEGPRDKYRYPVLTSYECGWWARAARPEPAELRHHLRDSHWLRERVRILAAPPPRDLR